MLRCSARLLPARNNHLRLQFAFSSAPAPQPPTVVSSPAATSAASTETSIQPAIEVAQNVAVAPEFHWTADLLANVVQHDFHKLTLLMGDMYLAIHQYTGLPWWATICAVVATTRLAITPLQAATQVTSSKMARIQPQIKKLESLKESGNQLAYVAAVQAVYKSEGLTLLSSFKPLLSTIPFSVLLLYSFAGLRMLTQHEPELTGASFLWIPSLASADPTLGGLALPALVGAVSLASSEFVSLSSGMNKQQEKMFRMFFRAMMGIGMPVAAYSFPSAIPLMWMTSSLSSTFQSLYFRSKAFRDKHNLGTPQPLSIDFFTKAANYLSGWGWKLIDHSGNTIQFVQTPQSASKSADFKKVIDIEPTSNASEPSTAAEKVSGFKSSKSKRR